MKTNNLNSNNPPRLRHLAARLGAIAATALLGFAAQAQTPQFTNVWVVPGGTYTDLPANTGNNVRGVAISPLTTNVLYSSTTGGTNNGNNHVAVLDFANGSNYLAQLNATNVTGGTVNMQNVRVSDDGSVYVCNRRDGGVNTFTIYRWPSESDVTTPAVKIVDTAFTQRMGDHMDVRGSGTNTEIVVIGSAASTANVSTNFFIFRPTDATLTTFTNFSITIPGNTASSIVSAHGVTFEGTNNAIYVLGGTPLAVRRVSYDPATLTATVTRTNATDSANCRGLKYASAGDIGLLASVQMNSAAASAQVARIYQLPSSPTAALSSVLSSNFPGPYTGSQNGNGLGQVDARNDHFVFGAPGYGLTFFRLAGIVTNLPPVVSLISGGGTYVQGYPVNLSVTASGTAPLSYRWFYNTNTLIIGPTTNTYAIPSVQFADAGIYTVVVTNAYGSVTSSPASLTVLSAGYSNFATNLWTLAPGSRPYLTTGDTQRGLAYDAVSNVVVVVSRTPSNAVYLIDAATGADVGNLNVDFLYPPNPAPPGTLAINMVGVADDGAVYVGNLITSGASDNFSIYRWQNADPLAFPSQAYVGNPGVTRIGDTMSVRGAGVETEILCSFRTGTNVALFTTGDGFNFTPTVIPVTNLPADAVANGFAGLGLAFGPGNTFWAKSSGFNLRQVAIDTNTMTAQVVATYTNLPISEAPLGADNVNGFIATVAFGQIPQNLSIWDVSRGEPDAVQLDRELFGSNNANVNGTGAVAVDVAGGRIFALDSNNGIIAVALPPRVFITPESQGGIVTWSGPGTLQSSTNLASGVWTDLPAATSPYTNSAATQIYFRVKR